MKKYIDFRVDLHMHSCFSDAGEDWDYKQIVSEAIQNNADLIAVTDHDVITNVDLLNEHCAGTGISFLTGVEFSTMLDGNIHHIMGYGFDCYNNDVIQLMNTNLELEADGNNQRDDFCIKFLIEAGYPIDWEEYISVEGGAKPLQGKQFDSKVFSFLIEKGICKDKRDFFNRLHPLMAGTPINRLPDFPHPAGVIEIIKKAGGIPVLAHPVHRRSKLSLMDTFELFNSLSIGGLECYKPEYNSETSDIIHQYCDNNNLLITGGSDCHGRKQDRKIGLPELKITDCKLGVLMEKLYHCNP